MEGEDVIVNYLLIELFVFFKYINIKKFFKIYIIFVEYFIGIIFIFLYEFFFL